jgi:hypothetical protein
VKVDDKESLQEKRKSWKKIPFECIKQFDETSVSKIRKRKREVLIVDSDDNSASRFYVECIYLTARA